MKNFVLDTNVLLHEPASLLGFKHHNIFISPVVLKELDHLKVQNSSVAQDARQVVRLLDKLIGDASPSTLTNVGVVRNESGGKLLIPAMDLFDPKNEGTLTNDQLIIRDAKILQNKLNEDSHAATGEFQENETIFVSRDILARLLAKSAGLKSQDYFDANIKVDIQDIQESIVELAFSKIEHLDTEIDVANINDRIFYEMSTEVLEQASGVKPHPLMTYVASMVDQDDDVTIYIVRNTDKEKTVMECCKLYSKKNMAWGIVGKNAEQDIALRLLLDTTLPCVTLTGKAGSGKTLLSLAAGLEMVAESSFYSKMIVTTAASDLTDGIGFLPGTEEEKMLPWLGAFTDNLEVLLTDPEDDMCAKELTISHTASRYMQFKSINFMRGRSFQNTFVVVDEAQNLTPHQIKTLVTRVGEGSKIVLLGDLDQIDNKFLTVYSSGLTHVIENMMGSDYMGHVELKGSPRSVLAEDAAIRL